MASKPAASPLPPAKQATAKQATKPAATAPTQVPASRTKTSPSTATTTPSATMQPRLSAVTLAVDDIPRMRSFYEALGWSPNMAMDDVVFYPANGSVFALYSRKSLAKESGLPAARLAPGGTTLAYNVATKEEVRAVVEAARRAGATIIQPARDMEWGGHSGMFADPEGHLWELAWNPHWPMDAHGNIVLGTA